MNEDTKSAIEAERRMTRIEGKIDEINDILKKHIECQEKRDEKQDIAIKSLEINKANASDLNKTNSYLIGGLIWLSSLLLITLGSIIWFLIINK